MFIFNNKSHCTAVKDFNWHPIYTAVGKEYLIATQIILDI